MGAYWSGLSSRERVLLQVLAGLLIVLVVSLVIVRPVIGFRSQAIDDYDTAIETAAVVSRAARRPNDSGGIDPSEVRTILTRSATRSGIVINTINTDDLNTDVTISNSNTPRLYGWLAVLEVEFDLVVSAATIRPDPDGRTVSARISFSAGP